MTAAPLLTSGRLRPISLGGARLARPIAWALVGLLALVTLVAVFARQLAPHNPIQPVGPLNLPPLSPGSPARHRRYRPGPAVAHPDRHPGQLAVGP